MDGAIAFHGLLGLLILFATMIVLALVILIVTGIYFVGRSSGSRMKKHLLYPAVMLLIFDAFVYLSMAFGQETVWSKEEAMLFDERMSYIWIPSHVVGYVLLAVVFYYIGTRKTEITEFVDKLR